MAPRHRKPAAGPAALDRIIRIHSRLAAHTRVNAAELAGELEVSTRTIKRDIAALRHQHGAEIVWEPATGSYFCEKPSEHLPLLRITADEATAVALANRTFAAWGGTPLGQALESALTKIAEVVGNAISFSAADLADCITPPPPSDRDDASRHHFARLVEAIRRRRTLRLLYRKPGARTAEERHVDPLQLAPLEHEWTLFAHDHARGELRKFLLPRIEAIHHTGRSFPPHDDVGLRRQIAGAFGRHTGIGLHSVLLRFDAHAAPYLRERKWHPSQDTVDTPDGGVEVTLTVNHLLDVQRWVLSWGSHAEAIEPAELRKSIAREVGWLAARYKP